MKQIKLTFAIISLILLALGCQKMDRPELGTYPTDNQRTLLPGNLRFFVPFTSTTKNSGWNMQDSISSYPAFITPWTVVDPDHSVRGYSGKGADQQAIKYLDANDWAKSTSFTVAFWIKNSVPRGGKAQFLFSLPSNDFSWSKSAFFLLFDHDGSGSKVDSAVVKVGLQDQWFEFTGSNRITKPLVNDQWHHMAITYDQSTSKLAYFVDGQQLTSLPASITDVKKNGQPRGAMDFTNTFNFVLGGWNKHVGLPGPTDDWIQSWQGGLDQFRMYNKVLSAAEILSFYTNKE